MSVLSMAILQLSLQSEHSDGGLKITFERVIEWNDSIGYCVRQTTDGGYITGGRRGRKAFLLRTDEKAKELWTTMLPAFAAKNMCEGDDGSFMVLCDDPETALIRISDSGTLLWQHSGTELGVLSPTAYFPHLLRRERSSFAEHIFQSGLRLWRFVFGIESTSQQLSCRMGVFGSLCARFCCFVAGELSARRLAVRVAAAPSPGP